MPQSLDIAAFVFGAVLILLSLVVGSFKLFGAEVQGTVGRLGRVVAFALGLILIVSRLVPSTQEPSAVAHAETDGATTPVKADTDPPVPAPTETADDVPKSPSGRTVDVPARELLVGTWKAEYDITDTRFKTNVRYNRDGTFTGVQTLVSNGLTNQNSMAGTWRIRQLSSARFELTTRDKEQDEAETSTFRVLDHEKLKNEDLGFVVHRVAGD